jgi:flagellar basal-body rod protein FlgB
MALSTQRLDLLSKLLDVSAMRQDVIAQNVANINTPGYRTLEISFDDALNQAMASNDPAAIQGIQPQVVEGNGGIMREDGNNVDVDLEMVRLQKNALYFKVYTQLMANDLAQFRAAIAGR